MTGNRVNILGNLSMMATSLYVADLDAAVTWYRDVLGLEAIFEGKDAARYATYQVGPSLFVLEPREAAMEADEGSGMTTINLVTDRDPSEVRDELLAASVSCSGIVDSPGFRSFLVRDPDGNRFYVTSPRTDEARAEVETAARS